MPPPTCTGTSASTWARIALMAGSLRGLPAKAPFRSTTCRRRAPRPDQWAAILPGSSEKTGGRLHVALLEAHAAPVLQIDRGDDQHGSRWGELPVQGVQREKFSRSLNPAVLLFSGWNCVATMLSRAMAEVKAWG
jgi:hypothetical protein